MAFRRSTPAPAGPRRTLITLSWLALVAGADVAATDIASVDRAAPSSANCANSLDSCDSHGPAQSQQSFSIQWIPLEFSTQFSDEIPTAAGSVELGEQRDWQKYEFRQHEPLLEKLVRMRELRLLTLWQRDETRLFIGVGRDGIAGLNLSTAKRKKRKSGDGKKRDSRPVVFDPYRDSRPSIP